MQLWISALLLSFLTTRPVIGPAVGAPVPPTLKAPSAIVMAADTGQILYEKNSSDQRPPASMTKLMTLLLLSDALQAGKVHLTDKVPVSETAFRTGGAQIWLEPGEELPLSQLLRAIAIGSANDASVAVAEFISGSEEAFVQEMNLRAKGLGMTSTHYANSHGLDADGHLTSPKDLAILAREVLSRPALLSALQQKEDRTIRNGKGGKLWLVNHNKLLWRYPGIVGLKTGYTSRAGFCLTSAAKREKLDVVAVVMGEATSKDRFEDSMALLNWAFANYKAVEVIPAGKVMGQVSVQKGSQATVDAISRSGIHLTAAKGDKGDVTTIVRLKTGLTAPVRAGAVVGVVEVKRGTATQSYPLVAKEAVPRATFASIFKNLLRGALHVGPSKAA